MPRVSKGAARRQSKNRVLKQAKGYRNSRSRSWRRAKEAVLRAGVYAYRDRRTRKREYRSLWIIRLNAACRERGLRYSQFISGLKIAAIDLNRKMLSEVALADPAAFDAVVAKVREALGLPQAA